MNINQEDNSSMTAPRTGIKPEDAIGIHLEIDGDLNHPAHLDFAEHLSAVIAREIEMVRNETPGAAGSIYGPMSIRTSQQKRRIRSDESYQLTDTSQSVELTAHLKLPGPRQKDHE